VTPFAQILGSKLTDCAPEVQALHRDHGTFHGQITVERPQNRLLYALGGLSSLPPPGSHDLTLNKSPNDTGEIWVRTIGPATMKSTQWAHGDHVAEKLGAVTAITALTVTEGTLSMHVTGWRLFSVPMPRSLAPIVSTSETGDRGRYLFDIRIALPLIDAQLTRYHGHLDVHHDALPDQH